MHTLIVGAAMNRPKAGSKVSCMVGPFMRLEGCLIFPDLEDDKSVRSADFRYHLDAHISSFLLGGVAILLNKRNALAGQLRLDIDIRCYINFGHDHHRHDQIAENKHGLSYSTSFHFPSDVTLKRLLPR